MNKHFVPQFRDGFFESAENFRQEYKKCVERLDRDPLDYKARNRLIDLLSDKCCEGKSYANEKWEYAYKSEYANKVETFKMLRDVSNFYRHKKIGGRVQAERLQLWSILKDAQCSLFIGDCLRALQGYKEALAHPIVVRAICSMDREQWWTDEFSSNDAEFVLKILYNMARIFEWMGLESKATNIYEKYSNIIKYKCESVYRISVRDDVAADVKELIQKKADILCGFSKGESVIYITESYFSIRLDDSFLDIGFEHPEEPFRLDIDQKIYFEADCDEVLFHDGIYDTGIARIDINSADFDVQKRKALILI